MKTASIYLRFAAAVAATWLLGGQGEVLARSLDDILKAGEIRVGVNALIPPRAQLNDKNELVGFEPDVAKLLADKLKVKLVLVNVGGPDRIPYVASDRIDVAAGGLTRTSERAKVVDFTVPLSSDNFGVITRAETGIKTFEALNNENVTVALSRGSSIVPIAQRLLPKAKLEIYDNISDQDRAVAQGRADATVDLIDLKNADQFYPNIKWNIFRAAEIPVMYNALGVSKGNYDLRDWLNLALWELHHDGTIAALWTKWAGRPMLVPVEVTEFF